MAESIYWGSLSLGRGLTTPHNVPWLGKMELWFLPQPPGLRSDPLGPAASTLPPQRVPRGDKQDPRVRGISAVYIQGEVLWPWKC